MPISLILSLIGPVIVSTLTSIVQRMWKHGVSTAMGTAAGAGVIGLLQASGCDITHLDQAVIGLVAAAPGFLSTDPGKTDAPIWKMAFDKVMAARAAVPASPSQPPMA
jgi:hypothetical protein